VNPSPSPAGQVAANLVCRRAGTVPVATVLTS